jgi:uncharacterized damage-inducible protein DinB
MAGQGDCRKKLSGDFGEAAQIDCFSLMHESRTEIDPRYPIGRFINPPAGAEARAASILTLRLLPEKLAAAINGLSDEQLDTPYRDGGWTLRQLVHHVADSHMNAYIRMRLALTEDWPPAKTYEEQLWAELPDSKLPVGISLDLLTALHRRWVTMLEALGEADFVKGYVSSDGHRRDLNQVVALYAWHSLHHTAHATALRSRMGW